MKTLYESILDNDENITQNMNEHVEVISLLYRIADSIKQTLKKYGCKLSKVSNTSHQLSMYALYNCDKNLEIDNFRNYLKVLLERKNVDTKFLELQKQYTCWNYIINNSKLLKPFNVTRLNIQIDLDYVTDDSQIGISIFKGDKRESFELCELFIKNLTK